MKERPTIGSVILLGVTVGFAFPLGLFYLAKTGFATLTEIWDSSRTHFMAPERVRAQAGRFSMDAHLNVLEVREILWNLDQRGKDLFGPWHTWQISDFHPSTDPFKNCPAPYSPDFLIAWNKAQKDDSMENADVVLRDYFYIRVFYSELNRRLEELAVALKTDVRNLPRDATLNFEMEANEKLQASLFAEKETVRPQRILDEVITPFFHPL